jgi:hypothetical protein
VGSIPITRSNFPPGYLKKITSILVFLAATSSFAAPPSDHVPVVPSKYEWVRTLDVEGGAYMWGKNRSGAQFGRIETRYLDPDVNAFVGLIASFTRYNQDLELGNPETASTAPFLSNWGADLGIVRGAHLWEIDLQGANLGEHLAFGPAFVGEHKLGRYFMIFHRTAMDFFIGDTFLDSDQGLEWRPWTEVGLTFGYRIFAAQHMNRNGPRVGLTLHFNLPKMPFIFPSIG